ncbi:MAG: uroporphyrinogen-III synthase [Aestuariivita sp.]|nr:uroporphyrinogen-III synthase [Aestuariivita sp.]MCY4203394.1 uroporphyrinogen-III synthase [Aestuariivita sp.]MCY4288322.1 uroporphyrinogen-III synthase [Aestuariivita sp.]MCY4345648.1 uroporphyrinogen-III synthase [Aestuariivita sp.]
MTTQKPLLLITRPLDAGQRFVRSLPEEITQATLVVCAPLIEIKSGEKDVDTAGYRAVIFSSRNGVRHSRVPKDQPPIKAYCVGQATTEFARKTGWKAIYAGASASELVARLCQCKPSGPLLHLRGKLTVGNIASSLTRAGVTTTELVVYDQLPVSFSDEARQTIELAKHVIAPLFSRRTAELLAAENLASRMYVVALSPAVSQPCFSMNCQQITVAKQPTRDAVIEVLLDFFRSLPSG